jgi:hypothetical protein
MNAKFVRESLSEGWQDVLKPRSEEEINSKLENLSYEDYEKVILNKIEEVFPNRRFPALEIKFAYDKKTHPYEFIKYYLNREFGEGDGHAYDGLLVKVDNFNDLIQYKYEHDEMPKAAKILYDVEDEDGSPYFKTANGRKYYLNDIMRIRR